MAFANHRPPNWGDATVVSFGHVKGSPFNDRLKT